MMNLEFLGYCSVEAWTLESVRMDPLDTAGCLHFYMKIQPAFGTRHI